MDERTISQHNTKKVKLGVQVTEHHRDKLRTLTEMFGVTANCLVTMLIDEMYFEPMTAPTLRGTVTNASERTIAFFRKERQGAPAIRY